MRPFVDANWIDTSDAPHNFGKTIVCGHSRQLDSGIWQQPQLICIDTFTYGGANLTALEIIHRYTMRTWQVNDESKEVRISDVMNRLWHVIRSNYALPRSH